MLERDHRAVMPARLSQASLLSSNDVEGVEEPRGELFVAFDLHVVVPPRPALRAPDDELPSHTDDLRLGAGCTARRDLEESALRWGQPPSGATRAGQGQVEGLIDDGHGVPAHLGKL